MIVEPGGAVALAAVLYKKIPVYKSVVAVLSGGNVDLDFFAKAINKKYK